MLQQLQILQFNKCSDWLSLLEQDCVWLRVEILTLEEGAWVPHRAAWQPHDMDGQSESPR